MIEESLGTVDQGPASREASRIGDSFFGIIFFFNDGKYLNERE